MNVTSVKGRLALPRNVSYVVTNYAGEAFSDILRREMQRFDVKVSIIEPGNFGGATAILNKQDVRMYIYDISFSLSSKLYWFM